MTDEKVEKMRRLAERLNIAWQKYQQFMAKPLTGDISMNKEESETLKVVSAELRDAEKKYQEFLLELGS